jgi:hypothetical protein
LGTNGLAIALDEPHVHHVTNARPTLGVESVSSVDRYILRPGRPLNCTRPTSNARVVLGSGTPVRGLRPHGVRRSGCHQENDHRHFHDDFSELPLIHTRSDPVPRFG